MNTARTVASGISLGVLLLAALPSPSLAGSESQSSPQGSCVDVKPSRVDALSDGGQDYQFTTSAGVVHEYVPPASFNPLTASDEQLIQYGFSPEPTDPAQRADWLTVATAYKGPAAPALCWNDGTPHKKPGDFGLQKTKPNSVTPNALSSDWSPNWAGYLAHPISGGYFTGAAGTFTQPGRGSTACSGSAESTWAGVGGWGVRADGKSWGLIQAGTQTNASGSPFAWWEYVGANSSGSDIGVLEQPFSIAIYAGDTIYTQSNYYPSTGAAYWLVENENTGYTASYSLTIGSAYWQGNTAEWIVERPRNGFAGAYYPLQNFGSVQFSGAQALNQSSIWKYLADTANQVQLNMQTTSTHHLANSGPIGGANGALFTTGYVNCS